MTNTEQLVNNQFVIVACDKPKYVDMTLQWDNKFIHVTRKLQ